MWRGEPIVRPTSLLLAAYLTLPAGSALTTRMDGWRVTGQSVGDEIVLTQRAKRGRKPKPVEAIPVPATPSPTPRAALPTTAAPAPTVPQTKSPYAGKTVLALDMQGVGLPPETIKTLTEQLASALVGIKEMTLSTNVELDTLLGHAEEQERLGCAADRECLAKIARLAHSDLLLLSTAGKVGNNFVLTLTLVDAEKSTPIGKVSDTLTDLGAAQATLGRLVRELLKTEGAGPSFKLASGEITSFAVFDLGASGVAQETARNLTQVLSSAIKAMGGTTVISSEDVDAMLQLSETKAKMGCLDDTSCIAEIGGALGVDKLLVGNVGKLGESFVVSLRLIDTKQVTVDNRFTESFVGAEDQLIGAVRFAARKLLGDEGEARGQLAVSASETGGAVILDDKSTGALPLPPIVDLLPGRHRLQIEKPGFRLWQSEVYLDPGAATAVWADLQARPARWPFWSALTGTGVAAASGLVFGILAEANAAKFRRLVANESPRPHDRIRAEANARKFEKTANGFYIGAAILAVTTGVIALFTDWSD